MEEVVKQQITVSLPEVDDSIEQNKVIDLIDGYVEQELDLLISRINHKWGLHRVQAKREAFL